MVEEVNSKDIKTIKKRVKPEDFIGWESEDGLLRVTGIEVNKSSSHTLYKVTCGVCSDDKELFPAGYFVGKKYALKKGSKPCPCSKNFQLEDWQYIIKAARKGKEKNFIIHGFAEDFHGKDTKINCECTVEGCSCRWKPTVNSIINVGTGCPDCRIRLLKSINVTPEQKALDKCKEICNEMNYEVIGFVNGYKNNKTTRFEYICKIHGKQNVNYGHFINKGCRCGDCWRDKQKGVGNGNGYYPERKEEQDFLYVLNFNSQFIKVGRSFDVDKRIYSLKFESEIPKSKIHKLAIFTATHKEIYDLEQELHKELRVRGFQHYVDWSTECFDNDSLFILNKLLDTCGYERIY